MNRNTFLKASLMGQPPITCAREQAWAEWASRHNPLLSPSAYTSTGRHLNHFCVGSDPEFAFTDPSGRRIDATQTGMKVGLAAGCDQNERLVELRPWPAVSVVEHIAGILTALRWMYRVYNRYTAVSFWRAGAFFAGDGMGGHVHFGRKRPTRTEEVAALDGLACALKASGLFPVKEWDLRILGDRLGQHYGAPGDFRVQRHGYEYRSLPSWLNSPTVAFISVASSKLAVLDPEITTTWAAIKFDAARSRHFLRGLAKLYKGRDDDAYILYHLLTQTGDEVFKVDHQADFAPAWGFSREDVEVTDAEARLILPACIKPLASEVIEMRNHLLEGSALTFQRLPAHFVDALPCNGGYRWLPEQVPAGRHSGFGDLLHNLVTHKSAEALFDYNNGSELVIRGFAPTTWRSSDRQMLKRFWPNTVIHVEGGQQATRITVPKPLCQTATITGLRTMLLRTGLFPIWTVEEVQRESILIWMKAHTPVKRIATWRTV